MHAIAEKASKVALMLVATVLTIRSTSADKLNETSHRRVEPARKRRRVRHRALNRCALDGRRCGRRMTPDLSDRSERLGRIVLFGCTFAFFLHLCGGISGDCD
jgi:hypothetical protein